MRTLLLILVAWPMFAQANCAGLWDMSLVARALAEDKIPQESIVRVLGRIYNAPAELIDAVAILAVADHRSASIFAQAIRTQCEAQEKPTLNPA